ncbi:hypothetical protein SBRCBS47491_008571 [Sporothrix bragantina]|uniref:Heterokaryon incompatibility domain-containing protein n=1 Tax=Sporothrix bragantina TaxID=671064 RepID=A0ABP0CNB4_9PEZI
MHLLYYNNGNIELKQNITNIPDYAILSHTWGDDVHEVSFDDMTQDSQVRAKSKAGFQKVLFCVTRAKQDGLDYSWIDTCCIHKADFTELSEAINSMFQWYKHAKRCYVYLSDVSVSSYDIILPERVWEKEFRKSRWFSRGWTLQELVAPSSVQFFTEEGRYLGDKHSLRKPIHEVTGIPYDALANCDLSRFTKDERFSWAKWRDTKKDEDIVYCLFGIFDVSMPLIYGEGREKAFRRLRKEIGETSSPPDSLDIKCLQDLPTVAQLNHAADVLRGLIFMLVKQKPALVSYVRDKYDDVGKRVFEDSNSWEALSKIFTNMLSDERLAGAILLVDALDECTSDRSKLLALISQPSRAKWIVSSRNWPAIVEGLASVQQQVQLRLELNKDSVSTAVDAYIRHKVDQLAVQKLYDKDTKSAVHQHLAANAEGTFLWVALVCRALADPKMRKRHARDTVKTFPPGLPALYHCMIEAIQDSQDADVCWDILAIASTVYRPIAVDELRVLSTLLDNLDAKDLEEVIQSCGSFLTLREGILYFIHQSAKEHLVTQAADKVFPSGISSRHYVIFSQSLTALSDKLRRDMYGINDPGRSIDDVLRPDPDPLASIRYSCLFWADHLEESSGPPVSDALQDGGMVHRFFQTKYLYWLEALSLLRSMSKGVISIKQLDNS